MTPMSRRSFSIGLGVLAIIGAFVVVLNLVVNLGLISSCDAAKEDFVVSPDGKYSVVLGTETCGEDRMQMTARLLPSSDAGTLFSAVAPGSEFVLKAHWISRSELQIIYPRHVKVRYPPDGSRDGMHDLGAVKVTYVEK